MGSLGAPSPAKALMEMQFAYAQSMALSIAGRLNIAGIIAGDDGKDLEAALTAEEIGAKLAPGTTGSKVSVDILERLLRYLVSLGVSEPSTVAVYMSVRFLAQKKSSGAECYG